MQAQEQWKSVVYYGVLIVVVVRLASKADVWPLNGRVHGDDATGESLIGIRCDSRMASTTPRELRIPHSDCLGCWTVSW